VVTSLEGHEPSLAAPTLHEETRARPPTGAVPRVTGSRTGLPATRARELLDEDEEPRLETGARSVIAEPQEPPRRRTSATGNPSANWRRPSRLEMPVAPPPVRHFDEGEESQDTPGSLGDSRLGIGGRDRLRSLGRFVGVAAILGAVAVAGYLYRKPATEMAKRMIDSSNVQGMGQPIYIKAQSNPPARVTVRHNEANPMEAETFLGETPLDHAAGAHVGDTIVLENRAYAAHYEERLEFGQPNETKTIRKEFAIGRALPQLKSVPAGAKLSFWNGKDWLGDYVPNLSIALVEGEYHLEIRGDVLKENESVPITVKVVAGKTTPTVFVDLKRHLEQR
jgi:hypothetical protein